MKKLFTLFLALVVSVGTMFAESGTCGAYLTWELAGSTLTISGTGTMDNYTVLGYYSTAPWREYVESIEVVVVDAGVTSIGAYAFYSNPNLKEVHLGNTLEIIGASAFAGCSSLTTILFPNSLTTIYGGAFVNCGMQSISLPNSITYIGDDAFSVCKKLVSANIPNKLTAISDRLFSGCSKLASIEIPNGVTSIGSTAFQGCTSLTSVVIPNSVTIIGSYAFNNCSGLSSVTIGKGVETIKSDAFTGCSSLTGVYISDLAAWCSINHEWYDGNTILLEAHNLYLNGNIVTNLVIPNGVKRIKARAFDGCSSITSVSFPTSVDTIELWSFAHCDNLSSISIPNIKYIGEQAFAHNPSLTSIEVPSSVKYLGWGTFWNCTALKEVVLNDGLEEISGYAFNNTTIEKITIPETVQNIGDYVLGSGTNMHYIACAATIPPICGEYTFSSVNKSIPLYVPEASIDAYKAADQWKDFTDIRPLVDIFHVTFLSWDGTQLKAEYVESGKSATAPDAPEREGYIFKGWDKDFSAVAEDMIITAAYEKEHKPGEPEILDINLNAATEMAYTGCSATPSVDDNVLTVNYTAGGWQWAGVEFALDNITNVINISFDYKGDGANVVIYPYLRDSQGARWTKGSLWLNLSATEWHSITTYLPDALLWDAADYAFGDKPFVKLGFVANPGTTTEGTFYLRNLKIEYKVPSDPTAIDQITNDQLPITNKVIKDSQLLILRGDKTYTVTGQQVR